MIKTPEQMAEEHANLRCPEQGSEFIVWCMCKEDFLAGYQAAKDEMNSSNKLNGWISVKERLPEHGIPVLVFDTLANTIELMSWDKIIEAFGAEDAYFVELNEASHWMPLPEAPKGEK